MKNIFEMWKETDSYVCFWTPVVIVVLASFKMLAMVTTWINYLVWGITM